MIVKPREQARMIVPHRRVQITVAALGLVVQALTMEAAAVTDLAEVDDRRPVLCEAHPEVPVVVAVVVSEFPPASNSEEGAPPVESRDRILVRVGDSVGVKAPRCGADELMITELVDVADTRRRVRVTLEQVGHPPDHTRYRKVVRVERVDKGSGGCEQPTLRAPATPSFAL